MAIVERRMTAKIDGDFVGSNGDVGIWHETYLVRAGEYECVYNNMPPYGLAMVSRAVEARGQLESARGRLGKTDGSDAAVRTDGSMG
jgi:hypothetical protein